MRVAFHAPMKPADHPVPSGDRQMARALIAALESTGHVVEIVSRFRSWLPAPDADAQAKRMADARHEIDRIAASWTGRRPDVWLTYHNHYKAPDLIGPGLARRFALPYAIAEASHAPRRAASWGDYHDAAATATHAADAHLCLTARDRAGLMPIVRRDAVVTDLPPFIDPRDWRQASPRPSRSGPPTIVAVAMMRPGDKLASYRFLAEALQFLGDADWHLRIVGDGPARDDVAEAFAPIAPARVTWVGECSGRAIREELAQADLYAWPGFGEAFGLSYLEAQAMGCPVVALDVAGVSSVVRNRVSGSLVDDPTPQAFAHALGALLGDTAERRRLGATAAAWVREERTFDRAAVTIDRLLHALAATRRAVA